MEGSEDETDGGFAVIGIIMFIETPHLPEKNITLCVVDQAISWEKLSALQKRNIKCIPSFRHDGLPHGIDTHPDMTLCHLGGNQLIAEPQSHSYYQKILKPYGFQVHKGEQLLRGTYPYDIGYNVFLFQKKLFGNLKYVDRVLLDLAGKAGYQLIHVNQGYTKCAVYPVAENAVITGDPGLFPTLTGHGIEVLLLQEKEIRLTGFSEGLIGGAGGKLHPGSAAFFGRVQQHPEFLKIQSFFEQHSVQAESLSDESLQDHGSLLPLLQLDE